MCPVAFFRPVRTGTECSLNNNSRIGEQALRSNQELSYRGVSLHGAGFIVSPEIAASLALGRIEGLDRHIRPYISGRDLTGKSRKVIVIDLFGLTSKEVRRRFPEVYQWVYDRVKPERDQNPRAAYSENWWVFQTPGCCIWLTVRIRTLPW